MLKRIISLTSVLLLTSFLAASDSSDLLFRAGFDNGSLTADKALGNAAPNNFNTLELGQMAGKGIVGKEALFLDNSKPVIYPAKNNIDWRQGTISLWLSAQNWKPSDKRFQIFFEAWFPNVSSRFIIYKFHANSTLRFLIAANGREMGYITVPIKDEEWQPGMWHRIDAVWDSEKMLLFVDGKQQRQPLYFKQPLDIKNGDAPGGTFRLGINPDFKIHDRADISGYDEVRIYKRPLSVEEIAAGYEEGRSGKTTVIEKNAPAIASSDLLFRAGFDNGSLTADKALGNAAPNNFTTPALGQMAGKGIAGKGALFLDNSKPVIYPAKNNIDWRQGTISLWLSAQNWKPSDKRFQIFFEAWFPNVSSRFIIYKFHANSTLRFLIAANGREMGYITVPIKDEEWQPGMWHKIDAVWDSEKMLLFVDGKQQRQALYFKQPLEIRNGDAPGGTFRLGINPDFKIHDRADISGYDEVRIYKRPLTVEEIAAGYKAERDGSNTPLE